jgi:hypothetical protein
MQTEIAIADTESMLVQWGFWSRHPGVRGYAHQTNFRALYTMGGRPAPASWITDDQAMLIDKAVTSLGAQSFHHKIILLHFIYGRSGGGIARILNMPRSSAYNAIRCAVDAVHEKLYP